MARIKQIPKFNDTFDISKLMHIIKKSVVYYILIGCVGFFLVMMYLRYTPLQYESDAIIQINEEQRNAELLKIENIYGNVSLSNLTELIRSREFLKRTLVELNLYTSYYLEGKFLTSELYKKSPFFVEVENFPSNMYNTKIYVTYDEKDDIITLQPENANKVTITRNIWNNFFGGKMYLNVTNIEMLKEQLSPEHGNRLFFMIFNDNGAFQHHITDNFFVWIYNYNANMIALKYVSSVPEKTADIVNHVSEDFLGYNIEKKQEHAQNVLAFIEEQLTIVYEGLNQAEKQLQEFKRKNKISETNNATSFLLPSSFNNNDYERQKKQLNVLSQMNQKITSDENVNTMELMTLMSGAQSSESMIMNFLNGINQLQKERERLLLNVTQDNHNVRIIDNQIAEQKRMLQEFITITNERLKTQIESAQKIESEPESTSSFEQNEIEFVRLQRVYSVHKNFYDQLVSKRAEYLISKAGHVTNNVILQKADIPRYQIAPIKSKVFAIAIILVLIMIFILTLIRYLLYNNIMNMSDIARFTKVPISGVIPNSTQTNKINRFVVENKPNSIITEAFRTLRSNLEFMVKDPNSKKIVAITSTISGEGKTFIAINLGGVIALSGKRVVLIDLDLRRPKIHLTFKSSNKQGLSTILIGKDSYKDCLIKTEFDNFDVITSGPPPPNPAELANSENFDMLIAELKNEYDVIIIDTPPLGIVSDAIFSFKRADLPIYVTRANYSKRNFINNINYVSEQKKIVNASIVLNAAEIVSSKYGYGYKGYGYGYGYGYYSYGPEKKKQKGILKYFKK